MVAQIKKLGIEDTAYPKLLKEILDAPQELYYKGELPKPHEIIIGIVGTRKATHGGKIIAKQIAQELAQKGILIASGLALGIDSAAHEGALLGGGKTIAVLANGLDVVYPRQHYALAKKILSTKGLLLSEYPEGTPAYPNQFLERNRIISGLSTALILIEAPIRSGSLATARNALNQGREVLVVPGPANHPNYQGSHMLLREGARLVRNAEDVIEDLGLDSQINTNKKSDVVDIKTNLSKEEKIILEAIKNSKKPATVDKIAEETKLEPIIITQGLTFLTLQNIIKEKNGRFKLTE